MDTEIAALFNDVAERNQLLVEEIGRIRDELNEQRTVQRARLPGAAGAWSECVDALNEVVGTLHELQATNQELLQDSRLLGERLRKADSRAREIERAKGALEEKAEQFALSSRYKSEFLANMSHELRTPLNSLLILARLLSENTLDNLTPKQIEYAQTIHAAGSDLLLLINDILDLAKIESGTIALNYAFETLHDLHHHVERAFRQLAIDKGLQFEVELAPDLPAAIRTDGKRLQQILKNLLSNAFKFTASGKVALRVFRATSGWSPAHARLSAASRAIAFSVTDTGVGIPQSKQKLIFEAFQQADGTTSRQYGGTGLGLSISRELAALLGGEIHLSSDPGRGSTFTLYVPVEEESDGEDPIAEPGAGALETRAAELVADRTVANRTEKPAKARDDREHIAAGDRVLLVIESDAGAADLFVEAARANGFKAVVASNGESALKIVSRIRPDAMALALQLPDMEGMVVLDRVKQDPASRHIPVTVISADEEAGKWLRMGAFAVIRKPAANETVRDALARTRQLIERDLRRMLLADGDELQRNALAQAFEHEGIEVVACASGAETLAALAEGAFDCLVVGARLGDMPGVELVRKVVESDSSPGEPVLLYGVDSLSRGEKDEMKRLAQAAVVKTANSMDELFEEATLFLHKPVAELLQKKSQLLDSLQRLSSELAGRTALIVDDDPRNIFALTSVLEQHGMTVLSASNGREGIEILGKEAAIDVVLMDVMMPDLDGYDTVRSIRRMERFAELPIIAITARAMKGDREKCLEAGASDYLAKPVNVDQLMSLLRVWLLKWHGNAGAAHASEMP